MVQALSRLKEWLTLQWDIVLRYWVGLVLLTLLFLPLALFQSLLPPAIYSQQLDSTSSSKDRPMEVINKGILKALEMLGLGQPQQGGGVLSAVAGMPRPEVNPPVPSTNDIPINESSDRPGAFLIAAQQVAKDKDVNYEDVMDVMRKIAFHESNVRMSGEQGTRAFDPKVKQQGGGPGRGALQFEGKMGDDNAFSTAVKRAKGYFKNKDEAVPLWLKNIEEEDDATSLDLSKQMALGLYDLSMKKGADISKVVKGDQSVEDFWLNYWWAGPTRENSTSPTTIAKKAAFRNSQRSLARQR